MSIVQSAICDKLGSDADKILDSLDSARQTIISGINNLKNFLNNMTWSPLNDVLNAINNVLNNADSLIPQLDNWDELMSALASCGFLNKAYSPTALVKSITDPLLNTARDGIVTLGNNLPEFTASKLLDDLTSNFENGGINVNISDVSGALICLESICGIDITSRLARLNSFLTDCSFKSTGEVDFEKILTDAGVTDPLKISNITTVKNTFTDVRSQVSDKTNEGVGIVKALSTWI